MLTFQWRSKLAAKMSTIFLKFLLILETVLLWAEMHNNRKRLNVFGFEDWPKMKVCKRWARKECQLVVSQWWPCEEKIELLKPQKSNTFPVHRPQCSLNLVETKMRNMKIGISRLTERAWCLNLMETKMRMKMNTEYEVGNIQTDRQNELAKEASCSCHCPEFQSSTTRYAHSSTLGKVKRNKEQIVTVLNFNLQAHSMQWIPHTMHTVLLWERLKRILNKFFKSWFRIRQGWWEEVGVLANGCTC